MDYQIEAINILLNEECILQRYYPLIPYKSILLQNLLNNRYLTKADCLSLTEEALIQMGLPDSDMVQHIRLIRKNFRSK